MSQVPEVGKLEQVDLRQVWSHEAHSFTPWVLENADRLSEALGINLELHEAEHSVGSFSLDLIGTDLDSGTRVIIENQLEVTDHTHLGQIMTYAGGTHPSTIIWISKKFRDEHISALQWLNEHTDEDISFYGVQVSAVRIGNSLPAALFDVVARPNTWEKKVRSATNQGPLTSTQELYVKFWARFTDLQNAKYSDWSSLMRREEVKQSWITFSSGVTGAWYATSFGGSIGQRTQYLGEKVLRSELYFGGPNSDLNTARFEKLLDSKNEIEKIYGEPLDFEALPEKRSCRIAIYRPGAIANEANWDEYADWFLDSQNRLRIAFNELGGLTTLLSVVNDN
jgi:hypothetical protein